LALRCNDFADRRRIRGIGLAALDVGLHINRRHQPDLVTQPAQFQRPVVAGAAGLDADKARIKAFKEPQHLGASKRRIATPMGAGAIHPFKTRALQRMSTSDSQSGQW
jgi:hypothetical protein